jgi:hypothetical protein
MHVFLALIFSWGNAGVNYWAFEPFGGFSMELVAVRIGCIEVCTMLAMGRVEVFLCERCFLHYSNPPRHCISLEDVLE